MIQVSQLSKEERVEKIITEIHKKTANYMSMSPFQSIIEPSTLIKIIQSIEDRIYFISESPAFEFRVEIGLVKNTNVIQLMILNI
jgi:hypothetical protein